MEYITTDIVLSATLKAHGFKLIRIDVKGSRGTFVFAEVPKDFLSNYDLGRVLVNPIEFNNNIKSLTTSVRRLAQSV